MLNVKVTYPDETFSIRSFQTQVESIHEETSEFKAWFFWTLLHQKKTVPTRFGEYSLTDESITEKDDE